MAYPQSRLYKIVVAARLQLLCHKGDYKFKLEYDPDNKYSMTVSSLNDDLSENFLGDGMNGVFEAACNYLEFDLKVGELYPPRTSNLKVYGGLLDIDGVQRRAIVATKTQKKAMELLGLSYNRFKNYWSEIGNQQQIDAAKEKPNTVLYNPNKNYWVEGNGEWVEWVS